MPRTRAKPKEMPAALEIDPVAETVKPAQTFDVELTGGPLARNAQLLVDGKPLKKVTKAVIVADVNDAFRFQTEQIAAVVSVKITAGAWEKNLLAQLTIYEDDEEHPRSYVGRGQTVREALEDVLQQHEAPVH